MADSRGNFKLVDFRLTFWIGIVVGVIGALGKLWGMAVFGGLLFLVGVAAKRSWGKEKEWSDLTPSQRNRQILGVVAIAVLGVVLIVVSAATQSR